MASLPVVCGHMVGVLQVHRGRVILSANTPEEKEVSATEFERLGGRAATKKWRQSIRLIQPDGTEGLGKLIIVWEPIVRVSQKHLHMGPCAKGWICRLKDCGGPWDSCLCMVQALLGSLQSA